MEEIIEETFDEYWLKYRSETLKRRRKKILENMAKEISYKVLEYVGFDFSFKRTPLDEVARILNIKERFSDKVFGEATLHREGDSWIVTYLKGLSPERLRFLLAHEIGHIFLKFVEKKYPSVRKDEIKEKFCDMIAAELLVPKNTFEEKEFNEIVGRLTRFLSMEDYEDLHLNGPKLNVKVLEAMRRYLEVSRSVLIQQLNWTRFLDSCNCGILYCTETFNKNTGRLFDMRVINAALPSWIFIPINKRVERICLSNEKFLKELRQNRFNDNYGRVFSSQPIETPVQILAKIKKNNKWSKEIKLESIAEFFNIYKNLLIVFRLNL